MNIKEEAKKGLNDYLKGKRVGPSQKYKNTAANLIRLTWKQYTKHEHFILEFMQNAEDATKETKTKEKNIKF